MAAKSTQKNLVFQLRCSTQKYAWGKIGESSAVARLARSSDPKFQFEAETPYSELWMGTHPNGPSFALIPGEGEVPLDDWVNRNTDKLGDSVNLRFKGRLPFLFKVLSVNTALSIQAHPNKIRAEQLHRDDPEHYKDDNHKPEMAIALTDFQGLCAFRPIKEIAKFMMDIREFCSVVGTNNAGQLIMASKTHDMLSQKKALQNCFTTMMERNKEEVQSLLKHLVEKVKEKVSNGENTDSMLGELLLKLHREFPGDVGGFSIYFLNLVTLKPGEAMYLEANLPHCYLSGDCMECMACSDNVVRAGLTPKFIDVETLCTMLDYSSRTVEKTKFKGKESQDGGCKVIKFAPPISDFAVTQIQIPADVNACRVPAIDSASILICVQGTGKLSNNTIDQPIEIKMGTVVFISANEEASISVPSGGMLLFRAHAG